MWGEPSRLQAQIGMHEQIDSTHMARGMYTGALLHVCQYVVQVSSWVNGELRSAFMYIACIRNKRRMHKIIVLDPRGGLSH